ncbi:MAG: amidohydrolase family protein [Acidobacteriota bacterium]
MFDAPIRIPLIKDWHTHPLLYAALLDRGIDLNRDAIASQEDAIRQIRGFEKLEEPGWTIAYGWNSGKYPLSQRDFDDLPALAIINLSLHGFIINRAGRELLQQSDPEVVDHLDDQDWIERNLRRILNVFAREGASAERLQRFYRWLAEEHGVFYAEEMLLVGAEEIDLFEAAGLSDRTRFWASPEDYERLAPNHRARVHGIKLFTDGALGSHTAGLEQPFRSSPASKGMLLYDDAELENLLRRYAVDGKPMAIHAIGDRAIQQVVAAAEASGYRGDGEIRIEHAQFISLSIARRAKALGITLSMQPNFSDDSLHYASRLPEGYAERNHPFRMLIDEVGYVPGEDLLFGSDGMPHGVHEGLRQALFPPFPSQTLRVDEFVAGYCMPTMEAGHIEVAIDSANLRVWCQIVVSGES